MNCHFAKLCIELQVFFFLTFLELTWLLKNILPPHLSIKDGLPFKRILIFKVSALSCTESVSLTALHVHIEHV